MSSAIRKNLPSKPQSLQFVEIYVPIAIRKPRGNGPFPAITMGSGEGRGGMKQVEQLTERLAQMRDECEHCIFPAIVLCNTQACTHSTISSCN